MSLEDDLPRPKPAMLPRLNLEPMGVAELQSYVDALQAEILRVQAAIAGKRSHRDTAEAFFKPPRA